MTVDQSVELSRTQTRDFLFASGYLWLPVQFGLIPITNYIVNSRRDDDETVGKSLINELRTNCSEVLSWQRDSQQATVMTGPTVTHTHRAWLYLCALMRSLPRCEATGPVGPVRTRPLFGQSEIFNARFYGHATVRRPSVRLSVCDV